jgi:hypothetical protein
VGFAHEHSGEAWCLHSEGSRLRAADAYLLRNQGEHRAYVRSPEIGGCSVQQTAVEYHYAAIRVLSADPQILQRGFSPPTAAGRGCQLEDGSAAEVTGVRAAENACAVQVATWVESQRCRGSGSVSVEPGKDVQDS